MRALIIFTGYCAHVLRFTHTRRQRRQRQRHTSARREHSSAARTHRRTARERQREAHTQRECDVRELVSRG